MEVDQVIARRRWKMRIRTTHFEEAISFKKMEFATMEVDRVIARRRWKMRLQATHFDEANPFKKWNLLWWRMPIERFAEVAVKDSYEQVILKGFSLRK
jgi:ribosomal protein L34